MAWVKVLRWRARGFWNSERAIPGGAFGPLPSLGLGQAGAQTCVTGEKIAAEKLQSGDPGMVSELRRKPAPLPNLGCLHCSPPALSHRPTQNWDLPSAASLREKLFCPGSSCPTLSIIILLFERTPKEI